VYVCVCVCVCEARAPAGDTAASVVATSPYMALLDIVIIKNLPKVMGNPNVKKLIIFIINFITSFLDVGFCQRRVSNIIKLLKPSCHFKY
jgi:hypothetical protein